MSATPIALPASLTMSEAKAALTALAPQLAASAAPVIDASTLVSLDSSALALLLECQRQVQARGGRLLVTGAPPKLGQLARLYGVEGLLGLPPA